MAREIARREWLEVGADGLDETTLARLESETGLSRLTLRMAWVRGIRTTEQILDYLNPRLDRLTHPMKIRDMDQATRRLAEARARQEHVRIFGDYDVDGTTGAALLSWVFRDLGLKYDARQPDRFKDGYGLNVGAVEQAKLDGVGLLVTVDCGITSFAAAEKARELGVDLIVVDHHQLDPVKGLPPAVAVINPQRPDCESQLKQLCGCGLAFYLAMALRIRGRDDGWFGDRPGGIQEPQLRQHLDLVTIATAADMVPLTGDNRILVRHGLGVLKESSKPGVRALMEAAGLKSRELSPGHLGFTLGPRINASGRMGSASHALELLTTVDPGRGATLALELEKMNSERADVQNRIWDQVRAKVEQGIADGRFKHGVVVADAGWHEGVVGIVASRVTETFHRPAAVIALREDFGKGSVRSFAGKDVLAALRASAEHLLGFGGHRHAAGLSLALDRVEAFAMAFDEALAGLTDDAAAKPLRIEGEIGPEDMPVSVLEELERFAPFGVGNPEPVFAVRAAVVSHRLLKERHLKLVLGSAGGAQARPVEGIWFHAAEREDLRELELAGLTARWAGVPELNRFRGSVTPSLRIKDWRLESGPADESGTESAH